MIPTLDITANYKNRAPESSSSLVIAGKKRKAVTDAHRQALRKRNGEHPPRH